MCPHTSAYGAAPGLSLCNRLDRAVGQEHLDGCNNKKKGQYRRVTPAAECMGALAHVPSDRRPSPSGLEAWPEIQN